MSYEKPKQRKGYVLTAVWWDRDGRVTREVYERAGRAPPEPPADRPAPRAKDGPRRSLIAAERDLFS